MARRRKVNTTKTEIIQVATRMFLERGYTHTSIKAISDKLDISTGNLTFYFPTKEHLLAVLVEMLCDFQWKMIERRANEGNTSLAAVCLELTAMAAICEEHDIAKDFYISAYTHSLPLDIIRRTDSKKAKLVFGAYCPTWNDESFTQVEILISGIEYATLMKTSSSLPLDIRIAGALDVIMMLYCVPEEIRNIEISKVLAMDYCGIGRHLFQEFMTYIEKLNEQALDDLLHTQRKGTHL